MCPHTSDRAIALWGKACNFHRGSDPNHPCGNPLGMQARLGEGRGGRGDPPGVREGVAMNRGAGSPSGPPPDAEEAEIGGHTKLQGLSEETISILTQKRHELESHIIGTFDGNQMWFQERGLQFKVGAAHHD